MGSSSSKQVLGVFTLAMITAGSVDSVRNLPTTALFGSSLIFFFLLATVFFLLPSALVSAELASTSPEHGGTYVWFKAAFGSRIAYLGVWFQWVENVFYYPAILSFIAATLAYAISPELAYNKIYLISMIIILFWTVTLINILGIKISALVATIATLFGLILPMFIIMLLGLVWVLQGHTLQVHFTLQHMIPNFSQGQIWMSLTGIVLSLCGMELATVYGKEVRDSQRAFPRALAIAAFIIIFTLICGSLSIAIVLPKEKISLVAGIMEACQLFFGAYHLTWMLPLIAIMLVLGGVGTVNNWATAPLRGLMLAAREHHLPAHMGRENRHGAPYVLLLYQATIVTLTSLAYLLLPTVNASYWLLTVLTAELYMFMYVLLFLSAIRLRFKNIQRRDGFMIPGGKVGMIIVAGAGLIGAITTIVVGFIPPSTLGIYSVKHYEFLIMSGLLIMSLPGFFTWFNYRTKGN